MLLAAVGTALLAGCASLQRPEVERVATEFASGSPSERCDLLAPATVASVEADGPCVDAAAQLPASGDVVSTAVWGEDAQVGLDGHTLFLTRTATGWRIAAAGCSARVDSPYVCSVEGP